MSVPGSGRTGGAGSCPTVSAGIISAAGVEIIARVLPTPDDHFAAGPDRRVNDPGSGRVGGAGGCPTVGAGIVSAASVHSAGEASSAPDDHFGASPDGRVTISCRGRVGGLVGSPTIGAGVVSPAGVRNSRQLAPPQTIISLPVHTAVCLASAQLARWWCWWVSNYRCWGYISHRCSKALSHSPHPRRSSRSQSKLACDWPGQWARW